MRCCLFAPLAVRADQPVPVYPARSSHVIAGDASQAYRTHGCGDLVASPLAGVPHECYSQHERVEIGTDHRELAAATNRRVG